MSTTQPTIEELHRLIRSRAGVDSLRAHLEERHAIRVTALTPLDAGVF